MMLLENGIQELYDEKYYFFETILAIFLLRRMQ
jgi:hypothetical protein